MNGSYEKCLVCNNLVKSFPSRKHKYCSQVCFHKDRIGKKISAIGRKNISLAKMSELNPHWAGDKVGLTGLHRWVSKRLPKPKLCIKCKVRIAYDLANKGTYNRNLENWEWLCRKCHMESDGRMVKLKNNNLGKVSWNKNKIYGEQVSKICLWCKKRFLVFKYKINNGTKYVFCSKSCYYKAGSSCYKQRLLSFRGTI